MPRCTLGDAGLRTHWPFLARETRYALPKLSLESSEPGANCYQGHLHHVSMPRCTLGDAGLLLD